MHDSPPMLRYNEPKPRTRSGGSREEDVDMLRPLPLPPLQQIANLRAKPNTTFTWKALDSTRGVRGYLPPISTTN
jgi:hypothetical protein